MRSNNSRSLTFAQIGLLVANLLWIGQSQATLVKPGDAVLGQWQDGYWYPAKVEKVEGERLSLKFEDGDAAVLNPKQIAPIDWGQGTRVECNWRGKGKYYPGVVVQFGKVITVAYDDGDREETATRRCRSKTAKIGRIDPAQSNQAAPIQGDNPTNEFQVILARAKKGSAKDQYQIGEWYEQGIGVAKNLPEAFAWTLKAAKQGHADAQYVVAGMYLEGRGVTTSTKEAYQWYRKAADTNHPDAEYAVGWMHEKGFGVSKDMPTARLFYQRAAKQGHADAIQVLGGGQAGSEAPSGSGDDSSHNTGYSSPSAYEHDLNSDDNTTTHNSYDAYSTESGHTGPTFGSDGKWHSKEVPSMPGMGTYGCDALNGCGWSWKSTY